MRNITTFYLREKVEVTSVTPLTSSKCAVRADFLQRVLLLPQAVHTLISDGGEGAFHQPPVF